MKEIASEDILLSVLRPQVSVLLVTATDLETREVIDALRPLQHESQVVRTFYKEQTYYFGMIGIYGAMLVQSNMGSLGRNASLMTTLRAIEFCRPKAVIMVGIAFGIDASKQNIGDVIVSSHIIPYEIAKFGKQVEYRAPLPPASAILLNRVREIRDWEFPVNYRENAKLYIGPLLTGEKLIDNLDFRNKLVRDFPNAIGGEMEGAGVYAASEESKLDWLIVKGICDFADGNKGQNKSEYQRIAIKAAVSFLDKLLSTRYGFAELQFQPLANLDEPRAASRDQNRLEDLLSLFEAIQKNNHPELLDFRVEARQIVQTKVLNRYVTRALLLRALIPNSTLELFENRVSNCWSGYNEVLASPDGYLPREIDDATKALKKCICRELKRLLDLNGSIPEGTLSSYWQTYRCESG